MGTTDNRDPFAQWQNVSDDMYKQWEKGMTTWWDQVLDNPSFLGALGSNVAAVSKARGAYEKAVDDSLSKAHLPTRGDLVRVARIATLLEEKLLSVEDRVLEMQDKLDTVEKEALRARIEAAETRLELSEKLGRIEALLTARSPEPAAAKPRRSRAKKSDGAS